MAEKPLVDVIKTHANIDAEVTSALNSGKKQLMVTKAVLQGILRERYRDDAYMIYRNVELHDVEKFEATTKSLKMTINEKVFGHSKVGIADNRMPLGKTT